MVEYLSEYFNQDRSTLIKHSLRDIYEDLCDRGTIEKFEESYEGGGLRFLTSSEMRRSL